MALYPLDKEREDSDLGIVVREFLTFCLFASSLFVLLLLAHALINQAPA